MLLNKILKDKEFSGKYLEIITDLGFSKEEDLKARDLLNQILLKRESYSVEQTLQSIKTLIGSRSHILIVGGGPDANQIMRWIFEITNFPHLNYQNLLIIAIDGATELLAELSMIPHLVFTDLDGIQSKTVQNQRYKKSILIIHAHGDNMDKIVEFESVLLNKLVIGTTQTVSKFPVINCGGFTDGDRALHFIGNFLHENHSLYLVGFDFGPTIGKYTKPTITKPVPASPLKLKKLRYGAELTRDFCFKTQSTVYFLENQFEYRLKNELKSNVHCKFLRVHSSLDLTAIFPHNLLFLREKSEMEPSDSHVKGNSPNKSI